MRLSRRTQLRVAYVLNELLPPALRDAAWFMRPLMRFVFWDQAALVMEFKDRAAAMTDDEIVEVYRTPAPYFLTVGTDLNAPCMERILSDVVGSTVLEVGCGEGVLAAAMSRTRSVTACDIIVRPELRTRHPAVSFCEASVEMLPFGDAEFDTVVCTHTLEHVRELRAAMDELRRVAKHRVIVVVPKERPYRYSFNLHLHFFPYCWTLRTALGRTEGTTAVPETLGGDWYHLENLHADRDRRAPPRRP